MKFEKQHGVKMTNQTPIGKRLVVVCFLATVIVVSVAQETLAAEPQADPAHAAHVAAGLMPSDSAKGDPAIAQQLSQLREQMAQLESTLAKNASSPSSAPAVAMPGMAAPAAPMPGMAVPTTPMAGMSSSATIKSGGMGGMAQNPGGAANMMGMMDKMMGMMDKMMSMGGAAMPAAAPMSSGGMKSEMGGMGGPTPTPAPGMSNGGGMGMDKMEMTGMMGMSAMSSGASSTMAQSALPGFPGASHLYHVGATGFFLDHPQHIALATEQQAALNMAKEHALLAKSTADRATEQAEQALWTLTASDQPDAAQIETKIREIEKLRGDERLSFIRAVGDASKILTDDQRKILTGFAPPTTAAPAAPAAVPMASGMKGM